MRRTTVRLNDDLMAAAKRRAAERRTTLTQLIEDALRAELARRPADAPRPDLPSFGRRRGGLMPGIDLDDGAGLLEVMERGADLGQRR